MKRTTKILLLDLIMLICTIIFIIISMNVKLPPCYAKELTGFDCPACGGTRMVINLVRFRFVKAFLYNPFMFIVVLYGGLFFLLLNISIINKKAIQLIKKLYCLKACYIFCAGLIIFTVVRNL